MNLKNIKIKHIGHLFVIIALYYIAQSISSLNIEIASLYIYFTLGNVFLSLISLSLYVLVLYIGSLLWVFLLHALSRNFNLPTKSLVKVYSKSNLGKYLPGNVMHYVARNVLAKNHLLSHRIIAASSFIEITLILISATLLLTAITFSSTIDVNIDRYNQYFSYNHLFFALCILLIFIIFIFIFRKNFSLNIKNIKLSIPSFHVLLLATSGYIAIYLVLGISQLLIMVIFDNVELTSYNYWNILYVFVFSWVIGFIVPGAPGGIGIREAIFILLLSQNYSEQAIILVAISYRLINIVGDVIFYILTNKLLSLVHSKT